MLEIENFLHEWAENDVKTIDRHTARVKKLRVLYHQ